ncbi:SusC/RagA family TonB-linked outer membrane protein [Pedobacter jeongneungensis]|uniref:SusC/RagA family TonB-linked outer membrane protein n=1 Tax=Pedobacter jeongneungensis TaxID=947309 RepID=UPI0004A7A285|nr:SusC/RagA family TonB-linked outer membrane protein [Pedobacter jeongneungensis]
MTNHYFRLVRSGCRYLLNWPSVFCFIVLLSITAKAQNTRYTFTQAPLNTVISQISAKTKYEFVYDAALVKKAKPINFTLNTADIKTIMDAVVKGQDFNYEISNNRTIILKVPKEDIADDYILHGMVTDSLGSPLPGASVKIRNTNKYVLTDGNGHFNLNLSNQYNTLEISYIGYLSSTQRLDRTAALKVVTVRLSANASLLAEVVVNGFQTLPLERNAGAFSIVDQKKLNEQINPSILSALEGRVAGLAYDKNPYGIGADKQVIRGRGTFSISQTGVRTDPLIVIDGLPSETPLEDVNPYDIESVTVLKDAAASSIYGSRSANGVIILTTKKGNSPAKISLNTDFFIDTKPAFNSMHYASTADILDLETDVYNKERARYTTTESMFAAYGTVANGSIKHYSPLYQLYRDRDAGKVTADQVNQQLASWGNADYYEQYRDNVWQNAFRQRYNLSFSSSSAKSNTYTSINLDNSAQKVIKNNDQKLNIYFKNTYNVNKWLTTTLGFNGTYTKSVSTDASYDSYNVIQPRYASIVNPDGSLVYADYVNLPDGIAGANVNGAMVAALKNNPQFRSYRFNILESLDEGQVNSTNIALRGFANIQAKLMEGLNLSSQLQVENTSAKSNQYYDVNSYKMRAAYNALIGYTPATNVYTYGLPTGGRYGQTESGNNSYTFRNQLSFDRTFDKGKHAISAIAGFEMRQTFSPRGIEDLRYGYDPVTLTSTLINTQSISQTGLPSYIYGGNRTLSVLGRTQTEIKHRNLSTYANAGYTYLNKYNITGSVRVDQADFFGVDPEYKNRPLWSVGTSWNASNEEFIQEQKWISLLKLRATYGVNGNQNSESSKYLTARRRSDNLFPSLQYIDVTALPNPKLRWEKTETYNGGVDYAFLSNRLRGSIDVYYKKSTDLIVTAELDPTVGVASRMINNGTLINRGIEFTLGGDWLRSGDLTLSATFILGFNRSRIGKVNSALSTAGNYISSPAFYYIEGSAYNTLYAYRYGGMVNGYPYFLDDSGKASIDFDASGNPIVSSIKSINNFASLVNMGSLTPTYTGSFSQRIAYKNFELGALLVFSGGNVIRRDVTNISAYDVTDENITQRFKNGNVPDVPRILVDYPEALINSASTINTMWQAADINVVKGDYIKLRNISLSYNLPKGMIGKFKLPSAKFTAQVSNLWYASAAGDDIDPESYSGITGTRTLENPKSFVFGLNLTF